MQPKNLLEVFNNTVSEQGSAPCFSYKEKGSWKTLNWNDVYQRVVELTGGLRELGLQRGDRVCIFSHTRYEWTIADLAIISNGSISVPIYESNTAEQAAYILKNSEARVVVVEGVEQLEKVQSFQSELPYLKQIIIIQHVRGLKLDEGVYDFDEVLVLGSGKGKKIFEEMMLELTPDMEASYVYTSGTTGPPKGAILTHGNFLSEVLALEKILGFTIDNRSLLFLPLAHIFARVVQFAQIQCGFVQYYAESIDKLLDNLLEVRPHILSSVPRIFEKVYTRVMQGLEGASNSKRKIFEWAVKVGQHRCKYLIKKEAVPLGLRLKWFIAYRLVFSKLHAKMGNHIKYFISGGAPLSKDIATFFYSAGFLILEGYGLTETTAAIACNTENTLKIGTVGKTIPGTEIKIAEDGEILARGGVIFKGYFKRPEETKASLDSDGWFHTGDIGDFDNEGFLRITDRKKDIIVTAAGKNIAPQNIENFLKTDPLISQVMVHGDKRKYLSALVTLNEEEVIRYAKNHEISFQNYAELVKNQEIYHLIKIRIDEKNKRLAKYETIKKFAILADDFSQESGELTPTLKVKRKFTSEKYKEILDHFYQD